MPQECVFLLHGSFAVTAGSPQTITHSASKRLFSPLLSLQIYAFLKKNIFDTLHAVDSSSIQFLLFALI